MKKSTSAIVGVFFVGSLGLVAITSPVKASSFVEPPQKIGQTFHNSINQGSIRSLKKKFSPKAVYLSKKRI
ncbi:MAG: hypothetical protein QNJ54_36860 [Prochloraceae cyanobacterium]|nr:hypothetical protein [Prochloraceae cyanobacterium]